MWSKINHILFREISIKYYLFISFFVIAVLKYKDEISSMLFQYGNIYIHPINVVLVTNLLLLLYIPVVYMTMMVVEHMCMKDYNKDGKPDLMFMDPYEYWKITHKK